MGYQLAMPTLSIGVYEIPYENEGEPAPARKVSKKGKVSQPKPKKGDSEPMTTVSVARILEDKYGVMAAFAEAHKDDITAHLIDSLNGALESLYMGAPVSDPFAEGAQDVAADFKTFLGNAEIESMGIDGVPTKAALDGRSLRRKGKKGPRRQSFVDTHLYMNSSTAWVDQ